MSVCLFRLTAVPALQGPVIKPLCTQPKSPAHIYLISNPITKRTHSDPPLLCAKSDATLMRALRYVSSSEAILVLCGSLSFFFLHLQIYILQHLVQLSRAAKALTCLRCAPVSVDCIERDLIECEDMEEELICTMGFVLMSHLSLIL